MNISEKCFNELVESIQRQIDKKVEKGEVTPDEALKLEKKVNDKMSPEKHSQEWRENYEKEAKVPGSLYNFVKNHQIFHTIEKARRNGKIAKFPRAIERAPQTENKVFPSRNEVLEAMEIAEAIINELNVETAKSALNKRTDQSMKADEKDKAEFNKIMKIKDINKRAQAYKEYDKRLDSRLNKENKRLDVYVKWAKDHPELVEAFTLIEAIISEVSVADLKNAASKVHDDREVEAISKIPGYRFDDPGDRESLLDDERYGDASRIVHLMPDPKGDTANTSANKLFNAAWKSLGKRREAYHKAKPDTPEFSKASKRYYRASDYTASDPVIARHRKYNKSEALEILEDLYSKIKEQPQEKRADLEAKYAKMKQKEGKGMLQLFLDQRKAMTKQEKGQEKTKDRSEKALGNYKDERRDYMDNTPHMYQFEALGILENIYNEMNLEEAISALLEYTEVDKKKAAKKVLNDRKREYLSKYANVLDAADIEGSENVPDGDMKDLERAEKRYEHAKKVANEAFEGTLKILELFDRPDLLNDIDTTLGSPVKKIFKRAIGSVAVPKKEKKS